MMSEEEKVPPPEELKYPEAEPGQDVNEEDAAYAARLQAELDAQEEDDQASDDEEEDPDQV